MVKKIASSRLIYFHKMCRRVARVNICGAVPAADAAKIDQFSQVNSKSAALEAILWLQNCKIPSGRVLLCVFWKMQK